MMNYSNFFSKESNSKFTKYWFLSWVCAVIAGTLLHFAYDVSSNNLIVGLFTPVNESVWEHLKLVSLPIAIVSVIHYILKKQDKFLVSAISIILASCYILFLHYFCKSLNIENMTVDILSYIFSLLIAFIYICKANFKTSNYAKYIGITLLILILTIFAVLTVIPPHTPLFLDQTTNTYGII